MAGNKIRKYYEGLKSTEFISKSGIRFDPSSCNKRVTVSGRTSDGKRQFEAFGFDLGPRTKNKKPVRCIVVSIDGKYHLMEFPVGNKSLSLSFR